MQHSTLVQTVRTLAVPAALFVVLWLLTGTTVQSHGVVAQHSHSRAATVLTQAVPAANEVIVEVSGFVFSPTVVTIEPGQTVTWIRRDGFHNVVADDGSYRSGAVSDTWDSYSHTFFTTGESRYYCEQHGSPGGIGMAGRIIVQASGQSDSKLFLPILLH